jgi:hypothetical protein
MADNPFDPKYSLGLLGLLGAEPKHNSLLDYVTLPAPKPEVSPMVQAMVNLLMDRPTPALPGNPFSSAAYDLLSSPQPAPPPYSFGNLGAVSDLFPPANPSNSLTGVAASDLFGAFASGLSDPFGSGLSGPFGSSLAPVKAAVKRKAFFSFHYDDIMRVNVVRNAWKIDHPDNALMRSFQDSSLWESRKLEGDDAVKRLIREGVEYTSAVCVLIGSETWLRRWVKYEIARAIIDGRGLLSVHLNSIRHHHTQTSHTRGLNPLDFMAVGKVQDGVLSTPRYYLFEKQAAPNGFGGYKWEWNRYSDYTSSVSLPSWLADPHAGYVTPLSQNASVYDYMADDGHRNIGSWIDKAAQGAGR